MKHFLLTLFLIIITASLPIKLLAQSDAGQDISDARDNEIDDQDRWADAQEREYCKTHKHEKGCFKTADQIRKQKEADIAVPIVVVSLFIGSMWLYKKVSKT